MALTPNWRLRVRIAAALALVVGVNGLLLAAFAWSALRLLSASGRSVPVELGLPLTVGTLLLAAVGLVAVQARYGSRTIVSGLDLDELHERDDSGELEGTNPQTLDGRVRRLAAQADVPLPSVAVADRPEPACLTVGTQRSPTIVVTTGLLERLDDDELDAALAHEVAHVANRDLPVVTAVAATVAIGDRLLERERKLRGVLAGMAMVALFTGIGLLIFAVPILVVGALYLAVSIVARALLGLNSIALGLFSKTREFAADRGASRLTGEPAAVASALETLEDERSKPDQDARLHASATLGIVPQPLAFERTAENGEGEGEGEEHWFDRWFVGQFSIERVDKQESDGPPGPIARRKERVKTWLRTRTIEPVRTRIRRVLAWRPPTHPATEERIEQLRTLERRRRG
ncbi:M48 family metallopeptidase [Natrialba aegyptia]|uniref:M48 family metallopeptidase n=1 Tax=Natrialba aegyptia TaxID=129789 RepID=UPI000677B1C1|nr:M48 family metalloprotease [Natrialba aegyptia]